MGLKEAKQPLVGSSEKPGADGFQMKFVWKQLKIVSKKHWNWPSLEMVVLNTVPYELMKVLVLKKM